MFYAIAACMIGALVLGVMAYMHYRSDSAEKQGGEAEAAGGGEDLLVPPAERFRVMALGDSSWAPWRPVVLAGGIWIAVFAGVVAPVYFVYAEGLAPVHGLLWAAVALPLTAGGTMALLLLVDLTVMIGGIGCGEVGVSSVESPAAEAVTEANPAPSIIDEQGHQAVSDVRRPVTLPLKDE